jgi:hypothetical protein
LIALIAISLAQPALAQELSEEELDGLHAPTAYERERTRRGIAPARLLAYYRALLDDGDGGPALIAALERVGNERDVQDLPRVLKFIGDLDPSVAHAANSALGAYGAQALKALDSLDAAGVDPATRKTVMERLLKDHIRRACYRDGSVNSFYLDYDGRFDELYSVPQDVNALILQLLRESIGDIRDDIAGTRYYYRRSGMYEIPFIDYGGLAVAALARHRPDELLREIEDLGQVTSSDDNWWGYQSRSPVTMEVAIFFARRGNTALIDKFIGEIESSNRWFMGSNALGMHVRIAALQVNALGEHKAALTRLNEALRTGTATGTTAAQAHFLRSRILMHLGEHGSALHALEDSMEASDSPILLTLVDSHFAPLAKERRFQTVLAFCRLAARRFDSSRQPWQPTDGEGE